MLGLILRGYRESMQDVSLIFSLCTLCEFGASGMIVGQYYRSGNAKLSLHNDINCVLDCAGELCSYMERSRLSGAR